MTDCFKCGDDDHLSYDCPENAPRRKRAPAAALASPAAREVEKIPPPFRHITRRDPDPPTPDYLQERQRLGMESPGPALRVRCPWCEAGAWSPCRNCGTGQVTRPHQARMLALLPSWCTVPVPAL